MNNKFYSMLWSRDNPKEALTETISNGIKYFKNKYKQDIKYIQCSLKDAEEKFTVNGVEVMPVKNQITGSILIFPKDNINDRY